MKTNTHRNGSRRTLTDVDRWRLGRLLTADETPAFGKPETLLELESTLEQAKTIPAESAPPSLVTMNSTVALVDTATGERRTCKLVYPEDRDLDSHCVGILQKLGRRILGRKVGDTVRITEGRRRKEFRIESIVYQPESVGAHHL